MHLERKKKKKNVLQFEDEGGLAGVDEYLALYRTYSESISGLIRQMLHDPLSPEKAKAYLQKLQEVTMQTGEVQVLNFIMEVNFCIIHPFFFQRNLISC